MLERGALTLGILAGGRATRLGGRDKAWLQRDGVPQVVRIARRFDAECGVNDLVRSNLGVYFTQTEMIFTLKDLPHVIFACTSDLVKIPLKDARPFLTDEGAKTLGLL